MTGVEIAMLASAAVSAAGSMAAGAQAQASANYNAGVQEIEALNAKNAAAYEEKLQRKRGEKFLSSQRSAIAASGTGLEGSSLLALEESAMELEKDALAIRYSGSVSEARSKSQAAADRMAGRAAKTASMFQAGSSLLTGASKVSWGKLKR